MPQPAASRNPPAWRAALFLGGISAIVAIFCPSPCALARRARARVGEGDELSKLESGVNGGGTEEANDTGKDHVIELGNLKPAETRTASEDTSLTQRNARRDEQVRARKRKRQSAKHFSDIFNNQNSLQEIAWRDIHLSIGEASGKGNKGNKCKKKQSSGKEVGPKEILKGISGRCKQGRFMAIMGPSGSGKTTLLDVLAARTKQKKYTGDVMVDGLKVEGKIRTNFQKRCGFIQQKDVFMATSTVKEHLQFQARLLGASDEAVRKIMKLLRITKTADSIIGAEEAWVGKGISGGEMKRLAVAAELLKNPYFLLADEPTSGLDSALAEDAVRVLREVAEETQRIVLSTIHQPSTVMYNLFDDICLMAEGKVVFLGTREKAVEYFESIGYGVPPLTNPADHWLRLLTEKEGNETDKARIADIVEAWERNKNDPQWGATTTAEEDQLSKAFLPALQDEARQALVARDGGRGNVTRFTRFCALVKRMHVTTKREPMLTKLKLLEVLATSILLGLVFIRSANNQGGVKNRMGAMFFTVCHTAFQQIIGLGSTFPLEAPVVIREMKGGMYETAEYFLARSAVDIPYQAFFPSLYLTMVFFISGQDLGLSDVPSVFFESLGNMLLSVACASSYGYCISALSKSIAVAMALVMVVIVPLIVFGGLFVTEVPDFLIWAEKLSFMRYAFENCAISLFSRIDSIGCEEEKRVPWLGNRCQFRNGKEVLQLYDFPTEIGAVYWNNVGAMFGLAVAVRFLAYLVLRVRVQFAS